MASRHDPPGGARAAVTEVALLADTHLPAAGPGLPGWVTERVEAADHVLHAGDFLTPRAHFRLRVLADGEMTAVRGNRDPNLPLPEVATYEAGGVRFVLTHGDGLGRGAAYREALATLAVDHDAAVAVGGHTHTVVDATVDGVRLLNPGSATGATPADAPTMLSVRCADGRFTVEHCE